jgi:hypothetical protein
MSDHEKSRTLRHRIWWVPEAGCFDLLSDPNYVREWEPRFPRLHRALGLTQEYGTNLFSEYE